MHDFVQVTTTVDDRAVAQQLADEVVGRRLAACVQVLGPIVSTYRWNDEVVHDEEWLCLMKTRTDRFDALERVHEEAHPYETPELVATPITEGSTEYLDWVAAEVRE